MTDDSHIPSLTISKIRDPQWARPTRLGAERPRSNRYVIRLLGGKDFWALSKWRDVSDRIAADALWRSTPSIVRYWVFRNFVKLYGRRGN